jgi:uncharacterized protein YbbC (DUF1343 family)
MKSLGYKFFKIQGYMLYIYRSKDSKMTLLLCLIFSFLFSVNAQDRNQIIVGANQLENYLPFLEEKRVAIVANQTSMVDDVHLVDTLLSNSVAVVQAFAPEHGFRGKADAGAIVMDEIDQKTGIPIISLYGKHKKPSKGDLTGVDLVIFDIQDVGARFYTYISTLHYVMEACAENNIPLLVLDRPNPNGHYVDGPILDTTFHSFVGMHPVPVVHGMTVAEYAQMINGEYWLQDSVQCDLSWVTCKNYSHNNSYDLPVKPSPNLPNAQSIAWYPSLCFFEGTDVSVGRGTQKQFQIVGSPYLEEVNIQFTPISSDGARYPKHENKLCFGWDLSSQKAPKGIHLDYILDAYRGYQEVDRAFFNSFFDKLAGGETLRMQIVAGLTSQQIKATWKEGLESFKIIRNKYLIYP